MKAFLPVVTFVVAALASAAVPATAQSRGKNPPPQLVVHRVSADLAAVPPTVRIEGVNLAAGAQVLMGSSAGLVPLNVVSASDSEVIAELATTSPGTYMLTVSTGPSTTQAFSVDLTIGAVGATGAQGPQGVVGPIGPIGLTGPQGAQGPQGVVGPIGPIGLTGPQGAQGPVGPQGAQGLVGAIGPLGPQGPAGPTGPKGNTGATGPAGPTGPPGPKGNTGATGATGAVGLTGVQGPQGSQGEPGPAGTITADLVTPGPAGTAIGIAGVFSLTAPGYSEQCPTDAVVTGLTGTHDGSKVTSLKATCKKSESITRLSPVGIYLAFDGGTSSSSTAGVDGGNGLSTACPAGTMAIGIYGKVAFFTGRIRAIGLRCAPLLSGITTNSTSQQGANSTPSDVPWDIPCGPGRVATGIEGQENGTGLLSLTFTCR